MVWTDRSLIQAAGHMLSEGGADIHPAGQDLLDGSGQLFWRGLFGEIGLSARFGRRELRIAPRGADSCFGLVALSHASAGSLRQ